MENKIDKVIGSYTPETDDREQIIKREFYGQGMIYKNPNAFKNKPDDVCYVPELSDAIYTRNDFMAMCNEQEDVAIEIFESVDWQHPESLIEEYFVNGELDTCVQCKKIFWSYDVLVCPHCNKELVDRSLT